MKLLYFASVFLVSFGVTAKLPTPSIHKIPGLRGATVELRFTNPTCGTHSYVKPVKTNSGAFIKSKPNDVYCKGKNNFLDSLNWDHSPRAKLLEWIQSPKTEEIFFAFQSISDSVTLGAICEAIKTRNIKVTFVISRNRGPKEGGGFDPLIDPSKKGFVETESSQKKIDRVFNKLTSCGLSDPIQSLWEFCEAILVKVQRMPSVGPIISFLLLIPNQKKNTFCFR